MEKDKTKPPWQKTMRGEAKTGVGLTWHKKGACCRGYCCVAVMLTGKPQAVDANCAGIYNRFPTVYGYSIYSKHMLYATLYHL